MDERMKLEKMDVLRQRFNVTYTKARDVLESCGWDTVEATIILEQELTANRRQGERPPDIIEELKVTGNDLVDTIKRLLHQGNINRIIVKDDAGKELLNLPVNGVIAVTVILPLLTAIGAVVAVAMSYTVVVERKATED